MVCGGRGGSVHENGRSSSGSGSGSASKPVGRGGRQEKREEAEGFDPRGATAAAATGETQWVTCT